MLATDLLQCIINRGHREGLFELPIPSYEMANYPIIQYGNDTILIMKASQRELFTLKGSLNLFLNLLDSGLTTENLVWFL
jgi:hypothetical protein